MLAVKAKYENGAVRWLRKPPVMGTHNLTVVFEDVEEALSVHLREDELDTGSRKMKAIRAMQGMCANLPPGTSLADELIAERRREAARDE